MANRSLKRFISVMFTGMILMPTALLLFQFFKLVQWYHISVLIFALFGFAVWVCFSLFAAEKYAVELPHLRHTKFHPKSELDFIEIQISGQMAADTHEYENYTVQFPLLRKTCDIASGVVKHSCA